MTVVTQNKFTELQEKFMDCLFENGGNKRQAIKDAGYHYKTPISKVMTEKVTAEIIRRAQQELSSTAPKAVLKLEGVLDDPTKPGNREVLQAAKEVLDRVGLAREERVKHEIETPNAIFVLPPKKEEMNNE